MHPEQPPQDHGNVVIEIVGLIASVWLLALFYDLLADYGHGLAHYVTP